MKKILVTGAFGLVGSDLILTLQQKHGKENIICLGNKTIPENFDGVLEKGNVTNISEMEEIITKHEIAQVYHLAGVLSAGSEKNPQLGWDVNYLSVKHMLDLAVKYKFQLFWPSSIGAFGPTTPRENTPQHTVLEPSTMYGVAKVSAELLSNYYFLKYGVDVRSLRYPGLIGYKAPPGDGTTEYSVHIFYKAIQEGKYSIFLKEDAALPMMYIDDAIRGTIALMDAPSENITVRTSYNFSAISFTPKEMVAELQKLLPEFTATYEPDERQKIADSWPRSIDDTQARNDWGWHHEYDLPRMTKIMLENIKLKLNK
ncbi:MAG TPA: NAD-dependent epimerase/dehydratase family protein [Candidatus Nitrosocosmicus sp.]|nr:NAD-dependent epimerase/dehydratase family protein [Candidatus Nitrosocosmicus sp.]